MLRSDLVWATKVSVHVFLLGLAFVLAYEVRRGVPLGWWFTDPDAARVFGWAALYALLGAGVETFFQTERSAWRFVSLREVLDLVRNVVVSISLLALAIFTIDRGFELPRSVLLLAAIFSVILLGCIRIAWRFAFSPDLLKDLLSFGPRAASGSGTPIVIVGPMAAADTQVRQLLEGHSRKYQPVAIVTPHSSEVNLRLHGVPVTHELGPQPLKVLRRRLLTSDGPPYAILFVGDPINELGFSAADVGELRQRGHILLRPQRFSELGGAGGAKVLKEIPLEEFLPRKPVHLDDARVREMVAGRRVLVTGAGGSIGSEICRQVAALGCNRLTLLDSSEYLLFQIDHELAHRSPDIERQAVLADVRDYGRVAAVMNAEKPDLIFHAAALKHVPLVEDHPAEGILTNVVGTWNVAEAARCAQVAQVVMISTDKAVDPTTIMGATKRLAEAVVRGLHDPEGDTAFSVVRFGNVLGSTGSVAPIFLEQIRRGGPVTVTHPDVERYFMTIPEAVQLVLHASTECQSRDVAQPSVFVLNMGKPVKILELAKNMISLHGLQPENDIPIVFTGLRPGEKLSEDLVDVSERVLVHLDSVDQVIDNQLSAVLTADAVQALHALARSADEAKARLAIYDHVNRLRGVSDKGAGK